MGRPASVYGRPGSGDLYVTCQGGRNSRIGRLPGLGLPHSEAKAKHMADDTIGAELGSTVGPTVEAMITAGDLDGSRLLLLRSIIEIVCHESPVELLWDKFFKADEGGDRKTDPMRANYHSNWDGYYG